MKKYNIAKIKKRLEEVKHHIMLIELHFLQNEAMITAFHDTSLFEAAEEEYSERWLERDILRNMLAQAIENASGDGT